VLPVFDFVFLLLNTTEAFIHSISKTALFLLEKIVKRFVADDDATTFALEAIRECASPSRFFFFTSSYSISNQFIAIEQPVVMLFPHLSL
jgi:hypothetical protein